MIAQIDINTRRARYFDVRRLTPREVYRLQGVSEGDIDLLLKKRPRGEYEDGTEQLLFGEDEWLSMGGSDEIPVIPVHEHYKLAGNSIVVDVLTAIFRQLFRPGVGQGDERCWQYRHPSTRPITMISLCSGYDAQCLALQRLVDQIEADEVEPPLSYRLVSWSEYDPESVRPLRRQPAVMAHDLLFPDAARLNMGDMTRIKWSQVVPERIGYGELDLLTYSTPCQDISKAGRQAGIGKGTGTRSAVLWHTEKAIEALRPRFLLQENVATLVSRKVMPHFKEWLRLVEGYGYRNYWAVLNAKRFGVPQNRDRVFCVSVRQDVAPGMVFSWPSPSAARSAVSDILEKDVERQYFLSAGGVVAFLKKIEKQPHVYTECDHKLNGDEIRQVIQDNIS